MTHYISEKILAKRLEKGYSQKYMAASLKITEDFYNEIEEGKVDMTIKIISEIMEILNMETSDLFGSNSKAQKL